MNGSLDTGSIPVGSTNNKGSALAVLPLLLTKPRMNPLALEALKLQSNQQDNEMKSTSRESGAHLSRRARQACL